MVKTKETVQEEQDKALAVAQEPDVEITTEENQFSLMDKADDEAIEAMEKGVLTGEIVESYVYSFTGRDGKEQTGLSASGTKAAWNWFNKQKWANINIDNNLERTLQDGYVLVTVSATDHKSNRTWYGASMAPLNTAKRDGTSFPDPFALPKAVTKAQRNALRGLMPDDLMAKLIKAWIKQNKVRKFVSQPSNPNTSFQLPSQMLCEGGCGNNLTDKAIAFYMAHPGYKKLCYSCSQKRKQATP